MTKTNREQFEAFRARISEHAKGGDLSPKQCQEVAGMLDLVARKVRFDDEVPTAATTAIRAQIAGAVLAAYVGENASDTLDMNLVMMARDYADALLDELDQTARKVSP